MTCDTKQAISKVAGLLVSLVSIVELIHCTTKQIVLLLSQNFKQYKLYCITQHAYDARQNK